MTSEMLAVILMIAAIFLILLELLWLYVISQNQEDFLRKRHLEITTAHSQIEAVLDAPDKATQEAEMEVFLKTGSESKSKLLCAVLAYNEFKAHESKLSDERKVILDNILNKLDPVPKLNDMLKNSNNYLKSYICRCLADLDSVESIDNIKECLNSRNKTLQYNAGMALSVLGDEDGVINFLGICQSNNKYSHRIILEVISDYSNDKVKLIRTYFNREEADDYMKANIIKAVKNDRLSQLKDIYTEGFQSKNNQLRAACVKAMSMLGENDFEQYLITASRDKDWIIRLSSLTGLEKISTKNAIEAVKNTTADDQWWVRKRAAEALVRMDKSMAYVEEVINGYDRYAAEAVMEVLYKIK